jgi:hypothetical protein
MARAAIPIALDPHDEIEQSSRWGTGVSSKRIPDVTLHNLIDS